MLTRQRSRNRQQGQALVLAIICMLVFVVGVLVLFNTGQVVNNKVKLDNTADAAAYSAAVQQARAYNLISYLNRAQVANEVAVAQMVSMHSWLNYGVSSTEHLAAAAEGLGIALDFLGLPEAGVPLNELGGVLLDARSGLQGLSNTVRPLFSTAITALSDANQLYSEASLAVTAAEIVDIPTLVQKVVKANTIRAANSTDKAAGVDAVSLALLGTQAIAANESFVKLYKVPNTGNSSSNPRRTADADRYANVVMKARDCFSENRNGDFFLFHKRGGTDLVSYDRWVGMDTLGGQIFVPVPLAWGAAAAVFRPSKAPFARLTSPNAGWTSPYINDGGHIAAYNGAATNHKAGDLAKIEPATPIPNAILVGYRGLHSYNDIAANKAVVPYDDDGDTTAVGPIFTVLVQQAMKEVRTTSNVAGIGGPPDLVAPDKAQNNKMTALATGQVYFDRPSALFARADKERELGSLFSPYWQARLIETPGPVRTEIFGATMAGL